MMDILVLSAVMMTQVAKHTEKNLASLKNIFAWSYKTKGNEFANLCRKMKRAQFMARRNWRKGLRDKFKVAYDDIEPYKGE